jgi:putative endonuclease
MRAAEQTEEAEAWFVYVLECENGMLYTGIAKNVEQRFALHLKGKGASFTRANPPISILASLVQPSHSDAAKLEALIKSWEKSKKLEWIAANPHSMAASGGNE